ncbi:MAG TPA: TQO small subunit DoxD [Candidatus Baltobacteraceae bacterium]|nr:TQO small subunit DoxD [Candidatus Baltobacteraceae bacterium]
MKLPSSSTYAFWLSLLRIYAGAFWLMHGIPKFLNSQDFMPPNGMMVEFLNTQISHVSGPYQSFLIHVVLPNASFFAELVRLGEVVTGALLLLGFYTRLGGLIGILLALNYISAKGGLAHLSVWSGLDSTALVLSAVNLVLPTGRMLGVDGILARLRHHRKAEPAAVFVEEPPMTGPSAPSP